MINRTFQFTNFSISVFSNLLDSAKSKDDGPFIFLDNSDAEEDGDREGQNNQDDREGEED